jgi:hypothetical protein
MESDSTTIFTALFTIWACAPVHIAVAKTAPKILEFILEAYARGHDGPHLLRKTATGPA